VDTFVRANRLHDIREAHPELVFLRLNDCKPLPSKMSKDGIRLRRTLLKREGIRNISRWLANERIGTGAKRDDVLDACAVAIAARDAARCVPDGIPPRDAHGLPMQIWC
jgi:predicted RNase H-like nuclease